MINLGMVDPIGLPTPGAGRTTELQLEGCWARCVWRSRDPIGELEELDIYIYIHTYIYIYKSLLLLIIIINIIISYDYYYY